MDPTDQALRRESLGSTVQAVQLVVATLLLLGLIMVYSTSAPAVARQSGLAASHGPLLAQGYKILIGLALFVIGSRLRPSFVLRNHLLILLAAVFLLLLVCVPDLSARLNGSRRWFDLGGLRFQPMEFARLALVIFLAARIGLLREGLNRFASGLLPLAGALALLATLLLAQPDFGSAVFFLGLGALLLILGGARLLHLGGLLLAGLVGCGLYAVGQLGHVIERFQEFLHPTVGDHAYRSLQALGSGGLAGSALGAGTVKLGYLPMANSDFILAAIGEELGLLGTSLVVLLFLLFTILGTRIAMAQRTPARFLLAAGIVISISTQAVINIAVVSGAVPTKGIALPFVSSGGSSLAISLFGVGLLVALARRSGEPTDGDEGPDLLRRLRAALRRRSDPCPGGSHG